MKLAPCPICKGDVKAIDGYWYEGNYVYPRILCMDRSCNLELQPVRYPWSLKELIELWNTSFDFNVK